MCVTFTCIELCSDRHSVGQALHEDPAGREFDKLRQQRIRLFELVFMTTLTVHLEASPMMTRPC